MLEYLCAEILELANKNVATCDNKKIHFIPRNITLVAKNDEELSKLLGSATILERGMLPSTHAVLLPKKTSAK